ncbi:MAG: Hpt domain-containing protein [Campylobacterota bacterium]|nr:Hpt domain-containing protein [Campylobacterota bacterium]
MDMDQNIFYDEFLNKLAILENTLVDVQDDLENDESINEIFRSIHTVKGIADLLCFFDIVSLAHKAEDILDEVREGKIELTIELCGLLLELKKFIKTLIDDKLYGYDIDEDQERLFGIFENEFISYMSKSILIIDNSAFIQKLIEKEKHEINHNIIVSCNQKDAMQRLRKHNIGLLFIDFSSSSTDAMGTIIKIRKEQRYTDLPIVILVNEKPIDLKHIGKVTNAKAWLAKPFKNIQFKIIVDKFLSTH